MTRHGLLFLPLLLAANAVYALPFTITASSLPTTYPSSAAYTITKNTPVSATGNIIKYLPPNVSINSSGTTCATSLNTPFTLNNGQSCTLNLTVSGPVSNTDSSPDRHLMVCLSDKVTCAGPDPDNSINANQVSPYFVAAGHYENNSNNTYMALANSNNVGASWVQQVLSALSGYQNGQLNGVGCSGNLCVGAGTYYDLSGNQYAAVAVSTNQGVNWSQQVLIPPSGYNTGVLYGSVCDSNNCVAVGNCFNVALSTEVPLIVTSNNAGSNWAAQPLTLPNNTTAGGFDAATCSEGTCIAVGYYLNNSSALVPGIAVSTDGGSTWSQQALTLPDNIVLGLLYGVSCTPTACIAVGEYENLAETASMIGIAVSSDGGNTWSQSTLPLPDGFLEGFFNGISCTDSYCVAVGAYNTANGSGSHYYPVVGVTQNNGASWAQQVLTIPAGYLYSQLQGVYCTGTTCVAAGEYYGNSGDNTPFVAVSTDSGSTWSQTTIIPPAEYLQGEFLGVG